MRPARLALGLGLAFIAFAACTSSGPSPQPGERPRPPADAGLAPADLDGYLKCRVAAYAAETPDVTVSVIGSTYDSYQAPDDVYLVDCRVHYSCVLRHTLESNLCTGVSNAAMQEACSLRDDEFNGSTWVARVLRLRRLDPNVRQPVNDAILAGACSVFAPASAEAICGALVKNAQGQSSLPSVFSNVTSTFTVVHQVLPGTYTHTAEVKCPAAPPSEVADNE